MHTLFACLCLYMCVKNYLYDARFNVNYVFILMKFNGYNYSSCSKYKLWVLVHLNLWFQSFIFDLLTCVFSCEGICAWVQIFYLMIHIPFLLVSLIFLLNKCHIFLYPLCIYSPTLITQILWDRKKSLC